MTFGLKFGNLKAQISRTQCTSFINSTNLCVDIEQAIKGGQTIWKSWEKFTAWRQDSVSALLFFIITIKVIRGQ